MVAAGCTRGETASNEDGSAVTSAKGDDTAVPTIRAAARALAEPDASVDYVAAQLEGVVKARTTSQALMHYDGFRVTMTTPGERVSRITFDLVERRPTVEQLSAVFGEPEEVRRGVLFEYYSEATNATIVILAETTSTPATETTPVKRAIVEGKMRQH
jgi:hypothetical protein